MCLLAAAKVSLHCNCAKHIFLPQISKTTYLKIDYLPQNRQLQLTTNIESNGNEAIAIAPTPSEYDEYESN